jgi:hypothetical protein
MLMPSNPDIISTGHRWDIHNVSIVTPFAGTAEPRHSSFQPSANEKMWPPGGTTKAEQSQASNNQVGVRLLVASTLVPIILLLVTWLKSIITITVLSS